MSMRTLTSFSNRGKCHDPSLRLVTKVRSCKGASRKWSLKVTFHALGNVGKCKGMNPHTPKWAPTLGIKIQWILKFSESNFKGQNSLDWKFYYTIKKILKLNWTCYPIWVFKTQIMAKKKVRSQSANLTFDY